MGAGNLEVYGIFPWVHCSVIQVHTINELRVDNAIIVIERNWSTSSLVLIKKKKTRIWTTLIHIPLNPHLQFEKNAVNVFFPFQAHHLGW